MPRPWEADHGAQFRRRLGKTAAELGGVRLNGTIEKWLGIDQEGENPWKASNLAAALEEAFADSSAVQGRVHTLVGLIADLFDRRDLSDYAQRPDFAHCLIEQRFPPPTVDFAAEAARPSPDHCRCKELWQSAGTNGSVAQEK